MRSGSYHALTEDGTGLNIPHIANARIAGGNYRIWIGTTTARDAGPKWTEARLMLDLSGAKLPAPTEEQEQSALVNWARMPER